jgi:hypothetical protein
VPLPASARVSRYLRAVGAGARDAHVNAPARRYRHAQHVLHPVQVVKPGWAVPPPLPGGQARQHTPSTDAPAPDGHGRAQHVQRQRHGQTKVVREQRTRQLSVPPPRRAHGAASEVGRGTAHGAVMAHLDARGSRKSTCAAPSGVCVTLWPHPPRKTLSRPFSVPPARSARRTGVLGAQRRDGVGQRGKVGRAGVEDVARVHHGRG